MNTAASCQTVPTTSCGKTPVTIRIRNQGHICSFKNTKKIVRRKSKVPGQLGTPLIITDPDKKQKMEGYTRDFASALSSTLATMLGATQTGPFPPYLIAQLMPLDDSLDWIPESDGWRTVRVAKGEEGVDVIFERIDDIVIEEQLALDASAANP